MNRCVPLLLAACAVPAAVAQMGNGPAAPPPPQSNAPQMSAHRVPRQWKPRAMANAVMRGLATP